MASASDSGGRMDGSLDASMVLPEPGGPVISTPWPPAAAIYAGALRHVVAGDVPKVKRGRTARLRRVDRSREQAILNPASDFAARLPAVERDEAPGRPARIRSRRPTVARTARRPQPGHRAHRPRATARPRTAGRAPHAGLTAPKRTGCPPRWAGRTPTPSCARRPVTGSPPPCCAGEKPHEAQRRLHPLARFLHRRQPSRRWRKPGIHSP